MALEATALPQVNESLVSHTLSSGLRVMILPRTGVKKTYATYATHYGSLDSHFFRPGSPESIHVPDGIAHFLEHKMFEKPGGRDVFERFAELGAYSNAYTEYTTTTFLFSATSEVMNCLQALVKLVEEPYFTEENVQKEKGIIEQEIRMYLDMPGDRLHSNLMRALYQKNPVRLDVAGSVESIRTITSEDLYTCYHTFYHPSNMMLFIAGDVDPKRVIDYVAKEEDRRNIAPMGPIGRIFPEEPYGVYQKQITQTMPIATPLWMMGYKDDVVGLEGRALLKRDLSMGLMWGLLVGPSSRILNDLYQRGLINERFSAHYSSAKAYGMSVLAGETPDPRGLEQYLMDSLSVEPFTQQNLERLKRKELGEFVGLFENPEDLAYIFNAFSFRGIDLGWVPELVEEIRLEDLESLRTHHLDPEQRAQSIIYPPNHP